MVWHYLVVYLLSRLNLSYLMHLLTPQSLVNAIVLCAAQFNRADASPS